MCLGVPGRVVSVDGFDAVVDFWGVERTVRLDVVDQPVAPGDFVLNHVGFAIRRIPEEEIAETLALYERLLDAALEGDPMAADVRGEIAAGGGAGAAPEAVAAGGAAWRGEAEQVVVGGGQERR